MNDDAASTPGAMDEALLAQRFGAKIKLLREKSGQSTRQLAARAGISQPFLSQLERGVSSPSMVTTYRLADALGVLPGALLPSPETELVTLVRAGEGALLPVASRADAAIGRALLMRSDNVLEVIEYIIQPGEYISEWFELAGELAMYLVSGQLDVEIEGADTYRLGPRDLLAHPASLRHRWMLVGDQPAHVLLTVAHPPEKGR
jgi:transcriptional regulator with XRE-family HTH domain